jgi:hypothetical protein
VDPACRDTKHSQESELWSLATYYSYTNAYPLFVIRAAPSKRRRAESDLTIPVFVSLTVNFCFSQRLTWVTEFSEASTPDSSLLLVYART